MLRHLQFPTLVSLFLQLALAGGAWAAPPIVLDKSQAVAGPRSDPGTGLCGSITKFAAAQPLSTKAEATAILDKATTDPAVIGRTTRIFPSINLRNGQVNATGDFTVPMYPDAVFPYSADAMAMPMGTDSNFTLRLRGYFNVPTTLVGKTVSFGVHCDDFCALRIGTTDLAPPANQLISARVIKQVTFKDAGLYPVELVYFQNGSISYLEWARTDVAVAECPNDICNVSLNDTVMYQGSFKPVPTTELYGSIIGSDASCQECTATASSCAMGNYCGDGLCQSCTTADHCGPSCQSCPTSARQCRAGLCVECTADAQCATGQQCEVASGRCMSPMIPPSYTGGCTLGGAAPGAPGWWLPAALLALALGGLGAARRRSGSRQHLRRTPQTVTLGA